MIDLSDYEAITDEAWKKVSDSFVEFKKQVRNYRKLSLLNELKGDAWYFGYAIGCNKFTTDDETVLAAIEEGYYEGVNTR